MIETIINFYNSPPFTVLGGVTATISILGLIYKIVFWFLGVTPVVFRLGIALWKREIAIFSSLANFEILKSSLIDSKIFKDKNIIHITKENVEKAKNKTVFLVDWDTFGENIETVFSARRDHQTAIVVYAKPQSIPYDKMNDIANRPNTVVVNFKGRLLNDILTSLITTSYE